MVVLPQILYLFSNIPYDPGRNFFKTLRSELIRLLWGGGKQSRIKWSTLTKPYVQGGLDIPDFEVYYLSAQAQYVHH